MYENMYMCVYTHAHIDDISVYVDIFASMYAQTCAYTCIYMYIYIVYSKMARIYDDILVNSKKSCIYM